MLQENESDSWFEQDYEYEDLTLGELADEIGQYFFQRPHMAELAVNVNGQDYYVPGDILDPDNAGAWEGEIAGWLDANGLDGSELYDGTIWGADFQTERQRNAGDHTSGFED